MRLSRIAMGLSMLGAMLSPFSARAEAKPVQLYAALEKAPIDPKLSDAVAEVEKACWFSPFSRSGPRPRDIAKCNKAEERLLAFGAGGARAALWATDRSTSTPSVRTRLYDVVARGGDLSAVRSLVAALERLKRMSAEVITTADREGEGRQIEEALQRITFAGIGERVSWDEGPRWNEIPHYVPWQAWLAAHEGSTSGAWLAERVTASRAHAADPDARAAFIAARFLALHPATQKEGVAALKRLATRKAVTEELRSAIDEVIANLPEVPSGKATADLRS